MSDKWFRVFVTFEYVTCTVNVYAANEESAERLAVSLLVQDLGLTWDPFDVAADITVEFVEDGAA